MDVTAEIFSEEEEVQAAEEDEVEDLLLENTVLDPASPSTENLNIETPEETDLEQRAKQQKQEKFPGFDPRKNHLEISVDNPEFWKLEKHVFILTFAGKPVFSRYAEENSLAPFMGVASTLVSLVNQFDDDEIGAIIAGDYKIVFLTIGPLYFICASRTSETIDQLRLQLRFIYYQLTAVLTSQVYQMLEDRPQFELRNLIGVSDHFLLLNLIDEFGVAPTYLLQAYTPVMCRKRQRDEVISLFKKLKPPGDVVLFSVMFVRGYVFAYVQQKRRPLHHLDLIILTHFVTRSETFKLSENWTPICFPQFAPKGFLHAYITYLAPECCIVFIAADETENAFHSLVKYKKSVDEGLVTSGLLQGIIKSSLDHPLNLMELSIRSKIPEVTGFLYHNIKRHQFLFPSPHPILNNPESRKRLLNRFQHAHHRVHMDPLHREFFERTTRDAIMAKVVPGGYELYISMTCFATKKEAQSSCARLLSWITSHEDELFFTAGHL